ncbi:hypothetical protein DHEL01_v212960 [Diaporthe helianthi]|uniref:Uncharacterized protein n=1 Tax=Diaporthe helianthi TaxID=158607 RepID=A0A2P5HEG1_DIAHE|nr:hypothetical protein DHEL01_v212960 [Diaporthe helianthi]
MIMNTGPAKFNQLVNLMPRLRELNIHLKVPLGGILPEGQLPLVKTLSVPINQAGAGCEATSIIRACPNVARLRLNLSGPLDFQTLDANGVFRVCRPEPRRALEAAAALKSLRDLELSKFPTRSLKWYAGDRHTFPSDGLGDGWLPGDLKAIVGYLPDMSSLALYGKSGIPRTSTPHMQAGTRRATPLGFVFECAGMANLNRLSLTIEMISMHRLSKANMKNWAKKHSNPAIDKAFEVFPHLQELSLVAQHKGQAWSPVYTDQKAGGACAKDLRRDEFVNSMYSSWRLEGDNGIDRWF